MLPLSSHKIVTRDRLAKIVGEKKAQGKKIVLANGAFDLFHAGHLRYLQGAKQQGDILIVAINDDESVRTLKGEGRPIMSCEERMGIVAAMEVVDYVVSFNETTVENIIREIKPDVHAKGTDYTEDSVPEREIVKECGGKTVIVGDPKEHSTSEFIARIKTKR